MRKLMVALLVTVALGAAVAEPAFSMRLKPQVVTVCYHPNPRITGCGGK